MSERGGQPPRVAVVTPFYNTADYLAECIESVLAQTFVDFEYLLIDNCSTDGSREIAEGYALQDERIRFVAFDEHLPQLGNYNRALTLVGPEFTYCKFAQADDLIMPQCLELMVALADTDERIGLVGAYVLKQNEVLLDGLDFRETVLEGREVGRRYLLDGPYVLGNPTTSLYRTSVVRECPAFFPPEARTGDAHAAMRVLADHRLGFVHQVLSVARKRVGSISERWGHMGIDALTRRVLTERYGERFLAPDELARQRRLAERRHYRVLGEGVLRRHPTAFWDLHRHELEAVGLEIGRAKLALWTAAVAGRMLLHPEWWFRPTWPWHR